MSKRRLKREPNNDEHVLIRGELEIDWGDAWVGESTVNWGDVSTRNSSKHGFVLAPNSVSAMERLPKDTNPDLARPVSENTE